MKRILAFLRALLTRRRANAEADDELAFHVEQETRANIARGMTPSEARRRALVALGGVTQTRERVRDARAFWTDAIWRDVKYAVRSLRRAPTFTLTVLVILGGVVGANGAAFGLADVMLWRPLPYPQPERLAQITWNTRTPKDVFIGQRVNGLTWELLRDDATSLDVAIEAGGSRVNFHAGGTRAFVMQGRVGAGYFRVLGVPPFIGREFTVEEDRPGGPAVALVSYDFWRRQFNGDRSVLGRTISLRGEPYEVVGVLASEFADGERSDVFTPVRPSRNGEGSGTNYGVIARLREGRTWNEARAEVQRIGVETLANVTLPPGVHRTLEPREIREARTAELRMPIQLVLAAALIVLLIAGVNVSALVLARGAHRAREIATRLALGSGHRAIVQQLAIEHLVLGLGGALLGVALGAAALSGLRVLFTDVLPDIRRVTFDARIALVTAGTSLMFAIAFGAIPALRLARVDVNAALVSAGSRSVARGSRHWTRRGLLGVEFALTVVLLVAAGLLIRTLANLGALDPGLDPRNVVATHVSLQDARYQTAASINRLFDTTLEELRATPGVESAAVSLELPYSRLLNSRAVLAGQPTQPGRTPMANYMYVTPDFFRVLAIPVRHGRVFTRGDRAGAPGVAIVNEAFVRYLANNADPVGQRFIDGQEIIGVVGNIQVRNSGLGTPGLPPGPLQTTPLVFLPATQASDGFFKLVHQWFQPFWTVRVQPGINAETILRHAIASADPLLPIAPAIRIEDLQRNATDGQRSLVVLLTMFAATALLLAAVGIYGLISQVVIERTRELGIRIALGASPGNTVRQIAASGLTIALTGIVIGGSVAWMAARLVSSLLYGVDTHDVATFAVAATTLLVVALAASIVPALRILSIDPARTLRD